MPAPTASSPLDLHAGQIQGFFDIPTDNLYAAPVMVRDIRDRFDLSKVMVVSPDVGGVVRARGLAKRINAPLAIIDKRRERAGESEVMNVIGEVEGRTCILIDDIVDSGGTLVNAADALLEHGAADVYAYITHGVLSGGAVARTSASRLKELVITDSIQAIRSGAGRRQYPRALDRDADRRSDRPHRGRGIGLEPVRLTAARVPAAPPSRPESTCRRQRCGRALMAHCGTSANPRSVDRSSTSCGLKSERPERAAHDLGLVNGRREPASKRPKAVPARNFVASR